MGKRVWFYLLEEIGVVRGGGSDVFVSINGRKEGIYLKIEWVDEEFFEKREV